MRVFLSYFLSFFTASFNGDAFFSAGFLAALFLGDATSSTFKFDFFTVIFTADFGFVALFTFGLVISSLT